MTSIVEKKECNLSKEVFWKYMLIAMDMTGKQLLNETSKFYYESLKHLTDDVYVKAIEKTLKNKKYPTMPMIGDILDNVDHYEEDDISNLVFTSEFLFNCFNLAHGRKYTYDKESGRIKLK